MTRVMQQKQKRPILIGRLPRQSHKPHQNSEHHENPKDHRSPGDPAFECAFNTLLLTLLGWEQKRTDNESFLSILVSSTDEEYRLPHGNQTLKGSGQPGNSPGAPVPVYGMSFARKV